MWEGQSAANDFGGCVDSPSVGTVIIPRNQPDHLISLIEQVRFRPQSAPSTLAFLLPCQTWPPSVVGECCHSD